VLFQVGFLYVGISSLLQAFTTPKARVARVGAPETV
jgi:hypothetical protein